MLQTNQHYLTLKLPVFSGQASFFLKAAIFSAASSACLLATACQAGQVPRGMQDG